MKIIRSFIKCTDDLAKKFIKRSESVYCSKGTMTTPDYFKDITRYNMQCQYKFFCEYVCNKLCFFMILVTWLLLFGQDLDCFTPHELLPSSKSSTLIYAIKHVHDNSIIFDHVKPPLAKLLPQYNSCIKCLENIDK